jgi:hypothetical protein
MGPGGGGIFDCPKIIFINSPFCSSTTFHSPFSPSPAGIVLHFDPGCFHEFVFRRWAYWDQSTELESRRRKRRGFPGGFNY